MLKNFILVRESKKNLLLDELILVKKFVKNYIIKLKV